MKPEFSVMPEREIPRPTPRKPLTKMERLTITMRQHGYCGCGCGVKLDEHREGIIDEHIIPLAYGQPNANDLKNRALFRKPCAAKKTAEVDQPGIAKAKRNAGETCNGPKREIPTHVNAWGPKGVRKIQSRGFQKKASTSAIHPPEGADA